VSFEPHRVGGLLRVLPAAALFAMAAAASACGFEDPGSIGMRRGALNLAFPESLHVGTAVWQAQLAGRLPRDPLAQEVDLSPEERTTRRLHEAGVVLGRLGMRMQRRSDVTNRPSLALVLLGPVHWSRFVLDGGAARMSIHVPGPEQGDVIVVTDVPVVEAIVRGDLRADEAFDLGLLRLYGPPADIAAAREWLADLTRN